MKYEELESKILTAAKDTIAPAVLEGILEKPELKKLFEEHNKLVAQGYAPKPEDIVPLTQSARYIRTMFAMRNGVVGAAAEMAKIQEEEKPKWIAQYGKKTLTYMNEGDNVQGGYLVPVEYYNEIMRIPCGYGIARRDCRIIPMNSSTMNIPTSAGLPTTYWIGEGIEKPESKPTFGRVQLIAVKQICLVVFTDELLADATPPIVQYIIEVVREVMLQGEDEALFNGNGGAGITGVLACGTQVVMDNNRQSFSQIHSDDLLKMVDAVACNAEVGGKFYFHKHILTWLRTLKDTTGNYILQPAVGNAPPTLWSYPYETSPQMPNNADDAVNTPFVIFTNMKKTVAFGDRQALTTKMLTEATVDSTNLAVYDMTALRFVERLDIECLLPTGIAVLYTAP
jgi:HK97 family phage major capsid protein